MSEAFSRFAMLNGTTLKMIAIISMTIDHIGFIFFPNLLILRYIGRLAFPIFAYMIAEGCYYTKNKVKYISLVFIIGLVCQLVMIMAQREFRLNIMFTLFMAIGIIYLMQWAAGGKDVLGGITDARNANGNRSNFSVAAAWVILALAVVAALFIDKGIPLLFPKFHVDYGIFGILLPVVIYISRERYQKLLVMAIWLIFLCLDSSSFQWFCLFALIPILLYNGKPGKHRMKYFFYLYYPIHLAILWGIKLFG